MVKRLLSGILAVAMVCCMAMSAGAVDVETTVTVGTFQIYSSSTNMSKAYYDITVPRTATSSAVTTQEKNGWGYGLYNLNVSPTQQLNVSGAIGIYFSYYILGTLASGTQPHYWLGSSSSTESVYVSNLTDSSNWAVRVYDSNGEDSPAEGASFSVKSYTPSVSTVSSPGITVSCRFTSESPITGFIIEPLVLCACYPNGSTIGSSSKKFIVPSCTIIASETSADLEALEGIADQIAESNAIAQAMYGDIMAALNSIKDDTGQTVAYLKDALTALNSMNTHAANIYALCDAYLKYLVYINNTATSIDTELKAYHEDFMSMMDMLNGTIIDESGNIQAKMEEIYNLLIAYLDTQYSSAVNPDLIESTGNAQLDIDRQEELEQGFQSNLTESWTDLKIETFALGGGYTSAVAWVSSWFSNFYNAMGDYGMILLLPLYIGIVTLVGGLARQAIRRSGRSDQSSGGKKDA